MSSLFTFNWNRCPNGYEVDYEVDYDKCVIVPKTHKREPYRPFDIGIPNRALFQVLADTDPLDPEEHRNFANNFGLLVKETEQQFATWQVLIKEIRRATDALEKEDFAELISMFGAGFIGQVSLVLVPGADPKQRPELRIEPVNLITALWIQLAEAATANLKIRRCKFPTCGTPFTYGPGTGRRSTARYCSSKCQKAHSYEKRKEAQK